MEAKLKDTEQRSLKVNEKLNRKTELVRELRQKLFTETQRNANNSFFEKDKEVTVLDIFKVNRMLIYTCECCKDVQIESRITIRVG